MFSVADTLPSALYLREDFPIAEKAMVKAKGICLYDLVERAGDACLQLLIKLKKTPMDTLVLAGSGNNGADAFVLARKLVEQNCDCTLLYYSSKNTTLECEEAKNKFLNAGGTIEDLTLDTLSNALITAELIIDGLIGIGFKGQLRQPMIEIIEQVNNASLLHKADAQEDKKACWTLSLDTPSGINVNTGTCDPIAINADATLCFGGLKQGLFTSKARDYCGEIYLAEMGITPFFNQVSAQKRTATFLPTVFEKRPQYSNKGSFGKLLALGGDRGMIGAICLTGEAALRAGAGLVTVASHSQHQLSVHNTRRELMFLGIDDLSNNNQIQEFCNKLDWASAVVLGPGMGTSSWGKALFNRVIKIDKPLVVDADALNLLSLQPFKRNNWILTPHPGEAARLLNCSIAEIESNRFAAIAKIHQKYGGVILLKGAGTLIYNGKSMIVAPVGNPGLASGGCGDVLAGIIGALVVQMDDLMTATIAACVVHGTAADLAAKQGERGMLAGDLMPFIRHLVN